MNSPAYGTASGEPDLSQGESPIECVYSLFSSQGEGRGEGNCPVGIGILRSRIGELLRQPE